MNKILSSLCYFSVFFAPFLFPIIVYFFSDISEVKHHAKRSFFSHLVPTITVIIAVIFAVILDPFSVRISLVILTIIVNFIVMIWNVVQGVKILVHESYI